MNLFLIAATACALFAAGYVVYGRLLARWFDLSDSRTTPACAMEDGLDYVPAKAPFLLGQHFSAIAAAGPIVGPILAGLWFGWLPALLWVVAGAIFFGAVHDFSALVGSVRHQARSIVEIVRDQLGVKAHLCFMAFVWLSLVYVIIAFTDLTSSSFVEGTYGGGVAASSTLYLLAALAMGGCLYKLRMPLPVATAIFVPLVGLIIWFGQAAPLTLPALGGVRPQLVWNGVILGYCFIASILPMWLLLQPRGYLGGFFLYLVLASGVVGLLLGGDHVQYPAFLGFTSQKGLPLFPLLFVTVACGACSGFHGIVSSGTTSKQIRREPDCRLVGYGGMLLEGLVAVIALSTVMLLAPGDSTAGQPPDRIYANGISHFVERFGIPREFARSFALLAFATFIYDTLDVATRLGRYILQELTGWKGRWGSVAATLCTLALPAACVSITVRDVAGNIVPAWKVFWTIFGTSNQLLAALTLLTVTVWLKRTGKPWLLAAVPTAFMLVMTLWSLLLMAKPWLAHIARGQWAMDWVAVIALVLLALAALILTEAAKTARTIAWAPGAPRRNVALVLIASLSLGAAVSAAGYAGAKWALGRQRARAERQAAWETLARRLKETAARFDGTSGVVVRDLTTGWQLVHQPEQAFAAASLVKVPMMAACFHAVETGELSLTETIRLAEADKVPGSGILKTQPDGDAFTVERLIELMIAHSDNTATNLLIDRLGYDYFNRYFERIGLTQTRLVRKMMDFSRRDDGVENYTSAADIASVFERLYRGRLLRRDLAERGLAFLKRQRFNDRIPAQLPDGTVVAHKTGLERSVVHDAGIVFTERGPFLICVLTKHRGAVPDAKAYIAALAALVHRYLVGA